MYVVHLINSIIGISLDTKSIQEGTREHRAMVHMIDRLGPYVPKVFEKIIKISKHYEIKHCHGKVSANTQLLEKMYYELLVKPLNTKIDWGIDIDFSELMKLNVVDFIKTVVLILIVIYAISKAMELTVAFTSRGGTK